MEPLYDEKYKHLEERGWWFRGRRDMLLRLTRGFNRNSRLLDIGCANGFLLRTLKHKGFQNLYGIDISRGAIDYCSALGMQNIFLMDGARLDFPDASFDVIVASDVLEHIEHETQALLEWRRVMKSGGILIVFAPAFHCLWSMHDTINHHHRRYSPTELRDALRRADFVVERISCWNISLFAPVLVMRVLQNIMKRSENLHSAVNKSYKLNLFASSIIFPILKAENFILQKLDAPFGLSVFACARKK